MRRITPGTRRFLEYRRCKTVVLTYTEIEIGDSIGLAKEKVSIVYTAIPMIFMVFMTGWAMIINLGGYYANSQWLLFVIGLIVLLLEVWMIIESLIVLGHSIGQRETMPVVTVYGR